MPDASGSTFYHPAEGQEADDKQDDTEKQDESIIPPAANISKEQHHNAPGSKFSCIFESILDKCISAYCNEDGVVAGTTVELCLTHCSCVMTATGGERTIKKSDDGFVGLED